MDRAQTPEKSLKEGYEVRDMGLGVIIVFGCIIAALTAGGVIAAAIIIRGYESRPPINEAQRSPLYAPFDQVPVEPHLQQNPSAERAQMVAEQQKMLDSYGLVNADPAWMRARIPVRRAMELVAEGKVPYRQEPQTAAEITAPPASAPGTVRGQHEGAAIEERL